MMKLYKYGLISIFGFFFLASCSNMNTVSGAPSHAGISKTFEQDFELVKAAVLASMQSLNINIKETKDTPEGFTIAFTKSISAFSWGEVGRVLVAKNDNRETEIFVHSARRLKTNITGASEQDFANSIFTSVQKILDGKS